MDITESKPFLDLRKHFEAVVRVLNSVSTEPWEKFDECPKHMFGTGKYIGAVWITGNNAAKMDGEEFKPGVSIHVTVSINPEKEKVPKQPIRTIYRHSFDFDPSADNVMDQLEHGCDAIKDRLFADTMFRYFTKLEAYDPLV